VTAEAVSAVAAAIVPLEVAVAALAAAMPKALWRGRRGQQRRGDCAQRSRRGRGGRAAAVAPR